MRPSDGRKSQPNWDYKRRRARIGKAWDSTERKRSPMRRLPNVLVGQALVLLLLERLGLLILFLAFRESLFLLGLASGKALILRLVVSAAAAGAEVVKVVVRIPTRHYAERGAQRNELRYPGLNAPASAVLHGPPHHHLLLFLRR